MGIDERKAASNVEHAKRWMNRANKDFSLFKKLVGFDNRIKKTARCSDPALAVYLLQQSVEKTVKAVAIASGQYEARDFVQFYRHNSLALIINLNLKMLAKIKELRADHMMFLMGIDLTDAESKLSTLENQVLGRIPLMSKDGKKVSIRRECMSLKPETIDLLLDSSILIRRKVLDVIKTTFRVLSDMGIHKGHGNAKNTDAFIKKLSEEVTSRMNIGPLSKEQLRVPEEVVKLMHSFGFEARNDIDRAEDDTDRRDVTMHHLAVWAFSYSLLWLSYITFAHESSSRYPLKHKGNIKTGRLGCDDYDAQLGIVNRIGQLGYAASLTLSEIKNEIEEVAYFFAVERLE
jgi:HEPN domain-containing protein